MKLSGCATLEQKGHSRKTTAKQAEVVGIGVDMINCFGVNEAAYGRKGDATWSNHLHQNPGCLLGHQDLPRAAQVVGKWIRASDTWKGLQLCQAGHARSCGASKQEHWLWSRQKRLSPHGEGGLSSYWRVRKKMQEGQGAQGNLLVQRKRETPEPS